DLHFEEVIARAERPALLFPALHGLLADERRISTVKEALGLAVIDITLRGQSAALEIAHTLTEQLRQFLLVEAIAAAAADAGGDTAEEVFDELADSAFDIAPGEI